MVGKEVRVAEDKTGTAGGFVLQHCAYSGTIDKDLSKGAADQICGLER